jgi:hypothetical protein
MITQNSFKLFRLDAALCDLGLTWVQPIGNQAMLAKKQGLWEMFARLLRYVLVATVCMSLMTHGQCGNDGIISMLFFLFASYGARVTMVILVTMIIMTEGECQWWHFQQLETKLLLYILKTEESTTCTTNPFYSGTSTRVLLGVLRSTSRALLFFSRALFIRSI